MAFTGFYSNAVGDVLNSWAIQEISPNRTQIVHKSAYTIEREAVSKSSNHNIG